MPVPTSVRYATMAVWAILVLAVLRMVLTLIFKDDLIDAYIGERTSRSLPREILAEGAPAYTGVALAGLVITVLLGLAAINLPKGARWARIVTIVFAVLSVLGATVTLIAPSVILLQIINVLIGLLSVAAIVLLFSSDANRFYSTATTRQLQ
jgi:hypothetical protein